jgi:hypothetical protein
MATREMALCIALSGATATAAAQTATATENWLPIGRPGPNGHWSRDVRAERHHQSERKVRYLLPQAARCCSGPRQRRRR